MELFLNVANVYLKILAQMLIFKQVSELPIKWKWFLIIPATFIGLFIVVPPIAYFGSFIMYIAYCFYMNKSQNWMINLFYGLFPVVVESLFGRMLGYNVFPMLGITVFNEATISGYDILIELLIFPAYLLIIKSLKINFKELKEGFNRQYFNTILLIINLSMILYILFVYLLVVLRNQWSDADMWRGQLNNLYIISFFIMLLYINATSKEKLEQEVVAQKDRQLKELSNYSHHVESLYSEIRSFRHDYLNILTSLKLGIENQDLHAIQRIYEDVLKESGKSFYDKKFDIARLSNIKNDAVKSVLSAKLLEAQNKGIDITVEVEEPIDDFQIEILDFITILSILCDNAIEASQKAQQKKLSVALIKSEMSLVLVVENTTEAEKVDVTHLFERGVSTKGEDRGLGLFNVQQIMDRYPKCSISTRSVNYQFSQTITFIQ